MKKLLLLIAAAASALSAAAQGFIVQGTVEDSEMEYPLMYASAAVLQKSGAIVRSTMADSIGRFTIAVPNGGDYTLRLSYIGYKTQTHKLSLTAGTDTVDVGLVALVSDDRAIEAATVTATIARVQQIGDTTQFNAEAYRVPEGSTLEALIKQLPGAEVSEDGKITYNGKTINSFLVNGKDFFKGDTKVAMKNLPMEIVSKIKAYDKKSDYAEQTGIDDGEEETVLDIITKRELNESWVVNADLAYGNHQRYSGRVFATRFTDKSRVTLFGSANNTGDRGFGGPRGFGGQQGLTATKEGGLDFQWENGRKKKEGGKLELGGSAYYTHTSNDLLSTAATETFLTAGASNSFGNNRNRSVSHSTDVWANGKLQWSPDSLTTITLRPQFTHSHSRNSSDRYAATFNANPYAIPGITDPLDSLYRASIPDLQRIAVNRNTRYSLGSSVTNTFRASLNLVRRLNTQGRNVSLRGDASFSGGHTNSYAISDIFYFQNTARNSYLNQFTHSDSKNRNYSLRLGYVEPLGKNWFAEARYEYSYRYQDSNRSLYNLHEIESEGTWADSLNYPVIGTLPTEAEVLQAVRDDYNSQYATYKYYNNNVNLGVRYNSSAIRFNAGMSFNPQRTRMQYERPGQSIDTLITRRVFNLSPEVRFRYRFTRTNSLDINYRGSASQPSMTNLLDVVDDSDPLNISMGNPGLKPSWSNTFRAMYRGYNTETQVAMMGGLDFSATRNSIANRIVYDDATGVRYSRPENINGNWNLNGRFMYNFGFGPDKLFTLTTNTDVGYNHSVGYVSRTSTESYTRQLLASIYNPFKVRSEHNAAYYNDIFAASASTKNTAKTLSVGERLNLTYRATYFDIGVTGSLNYQNARNTVQTDGSLNTWLFSYGLTANTTLPWGTGFSTDIRMSSRRGYAAKSMNTNELLWNAQISQSFLSGKPLTVSIQFYDILHKQSNVSRTINAQMRSDQWTNAINSYFMVHVIYRLSIFGGTANTKKGRGDNDDYDRPGPGMGGGAPMGPPPGGGGRGPMM